jgi:uncharacterized protein (TIGR02466 family)|tara:strand:+ start:25 stop:651 length:627 start_codon:yes stop_codon:yes gene_type:complete
MKKDELLMVFPTPVQIYKYENNIEKELKYIESIEWLPQIQSNNFTSKETYLTKHKLLKNITSFFKECIDDYCNTIINSDQKLVITQCWGNKNQKGSNHHEHIHVNSIISGVFYLRQNAKLPPIQFSKNNQHGIKLNPRSYNNNNAETFLLSCTPGQLILFPSSLRHSVPINQSDEERISLSFNTFSINVLGSMENLTHLDLKSLITEN